MAKTTWLVEHDSTLRKVRVTIESDDAAMVRRIEEAARKNGVTLLRDAGLAKDLGEPDPPR